MKVTKENITPYIVSILKFLKENNVNIDPIPNIILRTDKKNANEALGTTAFFDPNVENENKDVVLYIEGRHIKDVLRSFTHEMIHKDQLKRLGSLDTGTENINKSLRLEKIEADAYLRGNMLFRKWENEYKNTK